LRTVYVRDVGGHPEIASAVEGLAKNVSSIPSRLKALSLPFEAAPFFVAPEREGAFSRIRTICVIVPLESHVAGLAKVKWTPEPGPEIAEVKV
jgi:hypothetical protein